jgi:hypothetical protein
MFASLKDLYVAAATGVISDAELERLDAELRAPPRLPPDRQRSIERRKTLAATWPMPPAMACKLTPSEQAYARLLADDYATKGYTDTCHAAMAARIGCCAETVQRAQYTLRGLGWITVEHRPMPGRKHLPNLVRIVADDWIAWITNGPRRRPDPWRVGRMPPLDTKIGGHFPHATENRSLRLGASRPHAPHIGTLPGLPGSQRSAEPIARRTKMPS